MHIHILGICGTFMGGIALLARAAGHRVTGCDANVYPPMSTQLEALGIDLIQGFSPDQAGLGPDVFVIGNVVSRGNPLMEAILDAGLPYISGPQWLAENVLHDKWVLAVAGTHGKTTTSSMLAWILEDAGLAPGDDRGLDRQQGGAARLQQLGQRRLAGAPGGGAQAHRLRHGQAIRKVSQDIEAVVRSHALIDGIDDLAVDRIEDDDGFVFHAQGAGGVDPVAIPAGCTQLGMNFSGVITALTGDDHVHGPQRVEVARVGLERDFGPRRKVEARARLGSGWQSCGAWACRGVQ